MTAAEVVARLGRKFRRWQSDYIKMQGTSPDAATSMGYFGCWIMARDAADECDKAVARLRRKRKR